MTAREYDLPPMACLNGGLHVIDGKVVFSAIMIDALILKNSHKTDLLCLNEERCVIRFTRSDREQDAKYVPLIYEYTKEMARNAGYLTKKNWQTSLQDMLYCRCVTGGGRKHMPEIFVGVLVAGELVQDNRDENILPILPTRVYAQIQQQLKKLTEDEEQTLIDSFAENFPEEDSQHIQTFIKKYAEHWKKSIEEAIQNNQDKQEFLQTFQKWKKKHNLSESKKCDEEIQENNKVA
jgi:hypothetical protein